MIIIASKVRGG